MKRRKDGYYLSKLKHYNRIIPFVMPRRTDSEVFFETVVDISDAIKMIKKLNIEKGLDIGLMDLVISALVRMMSQKPKVNRFIMGKNAYARKEISSSVALKKEMTEEGETTEIKTIYQADDTLFEVSRRIRDDIKSNKGADSDSSQDGLTKFFNLIPNFLLTLLIRILKGLDRIGMLPESIRKSSSLHASFFLTNLGSLGIDSVYHHLYEIGTVSWFVGLGKRHKKVTYKSDGEKVIKSYLNLKIVIDERICDGYYGANAIRMVVRLLENPERLLEKPENIVIDNEI